MPLTIDQAAEIARINGYIFPRLLPSGEWAAICRFIFTHGLIVGLDEWGFRTRFCYKSAQQALSALIEWDGHGDPPGPWIKEKGRIERDNPANVCTHCGFTKSVGGCGKADCPYKLHAPSFKGIPITSTTT